MEEYQTKPASRACSFPLPSKLGGIQEQIFMITVDHGTEFTSKVVDAWAYAHGVKLDFIRPGKPMENAVIESFNEQFRDECLNAQGFISLHDARQKIEAGRIDYNEHRPLGARGNLTPQEFAKCAA